MLAPSEKHLEDWIVANPEKVFVGDTRLISRQPVLPSGIADLIFRRLSTLEVVELKKEPINTNCVGQVLRYMGDLQGIYECVLGDMVGRQSLDWHEFDYAFTGISDTIHGVLIGHGYSERHLPVICEGANISLITYDYDPVNGYTFETIASPALRLACKQYEAFSDPTLVYALKEIAYFRADAYEHARD